MNLLSDTYAYNREKIAEILIYVIIEWAFRRYSVGVRFIFIRLNI